jgi:putative peptidoglycan lipid II flippase
MAATHVAQQVANLTYGSRLIFPIMSVTSTALGTVMFPLFSEMVAEENWRAFQRSLSHYTRLILLTMIPITALLIVLATPIVRIVFQRGEFVAEDTAAVSRIQATFALMIPCYTLASIYSRVVIALRKSQLMLVVSVAVFFVNVLGNLVFKELLGVAGIALASVVNYVVQAVVLYMICRRTLQGHINNNSESFVPQPDTPLAHPG